MKNSLPSRPKSSLIEELLIVLIIILCLFTIGEISGLIKTGITYNFNYGNIDRLLFLLAAILGVMGVLINSRINIISFICICIFELLHQGIAITPPTPISIIINSILFQLFCASIIILSLQLTISETQKNSFETYKGKDKEKKGLAVEMIDLYKIYDVPGSDVRVNALQCINIQIKKGEFVAIMGPSGSGKSTLLNMIGALDKATRGKILIDGENLAELDDKGLAFLRNRKIGFVFQAYNLIARSTVLQNVEIPTLVSNLNENQRRKKAIDLLTKVGLADKIYRKPKMLSGGEQQRVAIARALQNNPTILLCDEPTGNLDTKSGERIMNIIKELNQDLGVTVIVVTHDLHVGNLSNRIYYLKDGKIEGFKENILI